MQLYQPAQIPELIGLRVAVNEQEVQDLSISLLDLSPQLGGALAQGSTGQGGLWAQVFGPQATETPAAAGAR